MAFLTYDEWLAQELLDLAVALGLASYYPMQVVR